MQLLLLLSTLLWCAITARAGASAATSFDLGIYLKGTWLVQSNAFATSKGATEPDVTELTYVFEGAVDGTIAGRIEDADGSRTNVEVVLAADSGTTGDFFIEHDGELQRAFSFSFAELDSGVAWASGRWQSANEDGFYEFHANNKYSFIWTVFAGGDVRTLHGYKAAAAAQAAAQAKEQGKTFWQRWGWSIIMVLFLLGMQVVKYKMRQRARIRESMRGGAPPPGMAMRGRGRGRGRGMAPRGRANPRDPHGRGGRGRGGPPPPKGIAEKKNE